MLKSVFSVIISVSCLLSFSCHQGKVSNTYSKTKLDCGEEVGDGAYFQVFNSSDQSLLGKDLTAVQLLPNGSFQSVETISKKGCIPLTAIEPGAFLLIRTADSDSKVESAVTTADSLTENRRLRLRNTTPETPESLCPLQYVQSDSLNPSQFVNYSNVRPDFRLFYRIEGHMFRKSETPSERALLQTEARPLMENSQWDISSLDPGIYDIEIRLFDYIRNAEALSFRCSIDTNKYELKADVGVRLNQFRRYFGNEYGVVEDGYQVNFYLGDEVDESLKIDYCVEPIDPKAVGAAQVCDPETTNTWLQSAGNKLSPGFYRLSYQVSKDQLKGKWIHQNIMVPKNCYGTFNDTEELNANHCTDVYGNIELTGDIPNSFIEQGLLDFSQISVIKGDLIITALGNYEKLSFPNLSEINSIELEFSKLHALEFGEIRSVFGKMLINSNLDLKSMSGLDRLEVVNDSLEIFENGLVELRGFHNLRHAGSVDILLNEDLEIFDAFHKLETISRGFSIGSSPKLKYLTGFSESVQFNGYLSYSDLGSLEAFPKLSNIKELDLLEAGDLPKIDHMNHLSMLETVGNFLILNNNSIVNFKGLERLKHIRSGFHIFEAPQLKNFEGLSSLEVLQGDFTVRDTGIEDFTGLNSLKEIKNDSRYSDPARQLTANMQIAQNPNLVSFNGLDQLDLIQGGIVIEDNSNLTDLMPLKATKMVDTLSSSKIDAPILVENCPLDATGEFLQDFCQNLHDSSTEPQ
ncbi:MAG: hypothetical protein HRU19_24455 [Pseudobacteriovorax sp.]|nr:hypothetical protein [Pseudobacteriovorax sp.]